MTRAEALAVITLWQGWSRERELTNRAYRQFVFGVVGAQASLEHLNCFEILDAITNPDAWFNLGRIPSDTTRADSGKTPKHGPRRQTAAARVVEVKEAAH